MEPAERDDVRLQAPPRRSLSSEAARERARADRGRREVLGRALPHGQGQPERLHAAGDRPGRDARTRTRCGSCSRKRTPGSSRCSPTRCRWPSWPARRSKSSATSRRPSPSSAPVHGCWTATARTSASRSCGNPQYFQAGLPTSTASRWPSTRTMPRACPPSSPASTISAGSSRAPSAAPTGSRSRTGSSGGARPAHGRVRVERRDPHLDAHRSEAVERRPRAPGRLAWRSTARASSTRSARASACSMPPCRSRSRTGRARRPARRGPRYYKHDPAEAKRLLAEAGYPNGFPASHLTSPTTAPRRSWTPCSSSSST